MWTLRADVGFTSRVSPVGVGFHQLGWQHLVESIFLLATPTWSCVIQPGPAMFEPSNMDPPSKRMDPPAVRQGTWRSAASWCSTTWRVMEERVRYVQHFRCSKHVRNVLQHPRTHWRIGSWTPRITRVSPRSEPESRNFLPLCRMLPHP